MQYTKRHGHERHPERRARVSGRSIRLGETELGLPGELAANAGRVVTHEVLLRRIWGRVHPRGAEVLRTTVKKLRRTLQGNARDPVYISTVRGAGYRMERSGSPAGKYGPRG